FEKLKESLKSFKEKIATKELNEKRLDKALSELKIALIGNDVAVTVAEMIAEDLKNKLIGTRIGRLEDIKKFVEEALREVIHEVLKITDDNRVDLIELVKKKKDPFVIVFVGFNGVGKTHTIAKFARLLQKKDCSVVMAASDTFRAGSIEQLEKHAEKLGVRIIKHDYGADAAAVAYDATNYARARNIKTVLVDTAGRVQTNKNLMDEMKKIVKVSDADLVIFIGDALAGNDAVSQAKEFNEAVKVDASILTKVDADVKGGAALSIVYITKKPIIYIGTGLGYDDLRRFDSEEFANLILS
ncbi:MAG: signal recognition particle-docking protein FtsY, partial [Promethearchaeota archaeon]